MVHQQPVFGGMGENASIFHDPAYRKDLRHPLIRAFRKLIRKPGAPIKITSVHIQDFVQKGFRFVSLDRSMVEGEVLRRFPQFA